MILMIMVYGDVNNNVSHSFNNNNNFVLNIFGDIPFVTPKDDL